MRAVRTVSARTAAREQNRERLASLGTMAAGLAHELNNPAAAARRAAADLAEALDVLASTIGVFVESGIEREQAEELVAMQREAIERAAARDSLSALDAADAEDALLDSLERLGVGGAVAARPSRWPRRGSTRVARSARARGRAGARAPPSRGSRRR